MFHSLTSQEVGSPLIAVGGRDAIECDDTFDFLRFHLDSQNVYTMKAPFPINAMTVRNDSNVLMIPPVAVRDTGSPSLPLASIPATDTEVIVASVAPDRRWDPAALVSTSTALMPDDTAQNNAKRRSKDRIVPSFSVRIQGLPSSIAWVLFRD